MDQILANKTAKAMTPRLPKLMPAEFLGGVWPFVVVVVPDVVVVSIGFIVAVVIVDVAVPVVVVVVVVVGCVALAQKR